MRETARQQANAQGKRGVGEWVSECGVGGGVLERTH